MSNGKWNDLPQWNNIPFVIEFSGVKSSIDTRVTLQVEDSTTATPDSDFTAPEVLIVTIPAGEDSATLSFSVADDSENEAAEFINLAIVDINDADGNPTGIISSTNGSASVEIVDNEANVVTLSTSGSELNESNSSVIISVSSNIAKQAETSVVLAVNQGDSDTAVQNKDYYIPELDKIKTIAGSTRGYTDGIASEANFNNNWKMTVFGDQGYLIADRDNHVIRLLDKSGNVSTYVGNGNYRGNDNQNGVDRLEARLSGPSDIAVNSSGEIFIVEQYSNAISKIDTDGNYQIVANEYGNWGSEDNDDAKQATFNNPRGIAFDSQGNLYVADGEHRIRKITFSGNSASVETYAGNGEWGENNGDRSDARFSDPKDIIIDAQDNLYIAEHNRIRKINAQGIVSTLAGSWWGENDGSLTSARFRNPTALAFDSSGNILVTDDDHNSLRIIYLNGDKAGQVQTLIGGNGSGFEDGAFADAKLKRPRGVVADATRILVSDTENNRIREISLEPTIVIPAGELSGSITLLPIDDDVFELDESISLNLSSSSNVDLANSDLTAIDVNLVSDDAAPTVRISANKTTLNEDGGEVTVSLRLSDQFSSAKADMEESLKSNYYYLGEFNGSKYYASKSNQQSYQYNEAKRVAENLGGTLAIINTQQENDFITQRIFDLDPNYSANDNRWLNHWIGYEYNQDNESWEWSNGQNIQFANWQGDQYITNPEGRPVARLHENGQWDNGDKNWHNQVVIEYSGAYSDVATSAGISYQLSGGAEDSDYSSSASETITIAAGEYKGEFTITGLDDDSDEGIETILVSLVEETTDATIDTNNSSVQIQIADNDLTTVTMSTDAGESISESEGAYSIIAELTNEKTYPITVDLSFDNTSQGAAVFGLDFDSPSLNKTSTLAGTGNYGFVDGEASIAQFESDIRSMVTDKEGNLYIADSNRSVIRKFDKATNTVSSYVGNPNGGSNSDEGNRSDVRVGFIRAMASDTLNNRLYFWDDWTRLVRRVNLSTGQVSFVAGDGSGNGSDGSAFEASFQNISAMTLGADGDVYFIDNTQLKKITLSDGADAIVSTLAGAFNNGGFNDGFGDDVRISWADLKGMALDLDGNIVFTDGNQHRVRKYDVTSGEVTTIAGQWWDYADGVGTNARFKNPIGLTITANGDIYVADAEDKRIRKIVQQDNGSYLVSTVAGNGNNGYEDGEASSSQFGNPLHLTTFGKQLAVFDQGNAVIRQIQLTPTITIPAGQKSGAFEVTAIDDVVYETDELIAVSVTPSGANLTGDSNFATTLTSDDNIPIVALEASSTIVKENGGTLEVELTLLDQEGAEVIWARNDLAEDTKASFNFLGEFDGHKYYQSFNEVTFEEALSVALSLGGQLLVLDSQQENEFIGRTIRNGSWLGVTDADSEGVWTPLYGESTYQNFDSNNNEPNGGTNENYAVTYGNQWYDVNSGNRHSFIIEFGPTKASGLDTVITLAVAGTATNEAQGEDVADFTLSAQQVTIPAGSNSATVSIITGNDSLDESIETIELSIAEIATFNDQAVATISQTKNNLVVEIDDDEAPEVSFSLSSNSLAENEGSTTVTATLSNPKVSDTEVRFAFAGEATFLDDYRSSDLGKVETIAGVLKGSGFVNGSADIARFSNVWGMVPYTDGSYLLADFDNNTIRKLNPDGSVENFIGNGNGWGNETGLRSSVSINRPTYLSVDDNLNVYFASQNNRVYKYDVETDRVSIIAGSGQWGYTDGVGQAAQFRNPFDLEVNGDGSIIYLLDYDNRTVRKLALEEDGQYTVSSLVQGDNNGNEQQVTGSFDNAKLGRPYELEVDWENNKIYTLGIIDWGYAAIGVLDLNTSTFSSTIIGNENNRGRFWAFDRDSEGDFYLTDSVEHSIVIMDVENPNVNRYSEEETGWLFQANSNGTSIFKFYRLLEDPSIIEAVVEYDFSGGSTIRKDGLEQGTTYGVQSNNTVITDTYDYFRHFEPGVYKVQINTNNLTYSVSKTSDIPTRGYTSSTLAGGVKGYADGTGDEAQFQFPTAILVDGSKALVYDDQNELLRSVRVKTAIIVPGRNTTASVDFTAYKDQYFEGEEVIELSIAGIDNGVSETSVFDPITITDATFLTRVTEAPFEGVQDGKVSWGDYDRDGDMDLLLMGSGVDGTITNIYRNNDGVFVNTNQNFTKYLGGDAEFVDVDQDGWLDVALSGNSPIGRVSELYINRGSDSPSAPFFQLSTNYVVEGLSQSDMEWGDLDNDGDPDLIISGINEENQYRTLYYTNLGNYTFLQEEFFSAQGRIQAEIDMFDSDNDGDLDVGISGIDEGDNFGYQFYTNSYYDASQNFDANYNFNNYRWLRDGKTMFLDLDVDSRMDYFAMGLDENRNTQQVSNLGVSLTPLSNPDFAFADYNNDGLNDVVITGEDEQGNPVTKLYVTLGGVEFGYRLFETDVDLVALRESTVDWIDYDLDGDLDLFMTGIDDTGVPVSVLYQANNVANLNEAPAKVANLTAVHAGNGLVQFDWDKPTDNANSEFRYALRVGTSSGASDVLYVNSTETGTRLIDEPALSTLNSRELILNPGTYFAAVQAIDAGNRGGAFSDEIQFTVDYSWKRLNLGGILDRSLRPSASSQIEFVDYDGDGDMDLIGSNVGTDYTYNGSAINIFGFENGVFVPKQQEGGGSSTFGLGDLNKNGFVDIVYAQEEQSGSRIQPAFNMQPIILEMIANGEDVSFMSPFRNGYNFQNDNLIPSLYDAKVAIKDLNNDGMPEVILAGASSQIESEATAAVYLLRMNLNEGQTELGFDNFYFTYEKLIENSASLEGLSFLSFDLGDVDGDADYDLLFTGFGFDGYETILFENTGNLDGDLFVETNNNFVAVREGSASFIDIDGDGLLDVVFSGQSGDGDTFRVYKNTGNIQNFAVLEVGLPDIRKSNVDFGDFNDDGYYDILYSGTIQGEGRTTRLAEFNPSTRLFEDSEFDVSGYLDANVGFGDFDGDGDLDFVLNGEDANNDSGQIQQIADIFINVRDLVTAQNSRISLAKEGNNSGLGAPTIEAARRRRIAENSYEVTVDWGGAKNKNGNPDSALTYELKVGTSKNGTEVLSTVANADGIRAVATTGNAESNTSWKLNLPEGTYFAQVQAVDASYQGSEFSEIFEFAVVNSFKLGDANGDDVVNVLDLTTNIEYIMTGVEPTAFVPEVADVNLDGAINVTDISGIVEIILNPETATSRIALSKAVDKSDYFSNKVVGEAELALQNGAVKLRSDREVVALQFSVNKDAAIRMNDRLASNFNVVSFERDNRMHYLVYSLNNQDILGVTDQLFTVSGNTKLDVSDLAANAAGVGTLSIEFLDESYLDQYNNGAVFYPNPAREVASLYVGLENAVRVQVELFNMQGTPVLQYATERNVDQINLNVSNLSSGLYAARIQITTEDGRTVTRSLKLVIQ
jgi:streptogramin lyase